ncbi:MAG TPA: lysophospholipid acyltransferase family protein [Candidatus Bathyarchaeia archaeon]|nr:lysophospholipid acyltransferase family protein [Candidatus Bathyarchaeia archaeon]
MPAEKTSKIKNIFQILAFAFFAYWLKYILCVKVKNVGIIKIKKPFIVVSNHVSRLDPFLILSALGWKNFIAANPWRFPLHKIYADSWWLGPTSRLIGCYKIEGKGDLTRSLESTFNVIDNSYSLIFFPEGQTVKKGQKVPLKKGIGYICEHKNINILPVKITSENFKENKKARLWHLGVTFGQIINSRDLRKQNGLENLHLGIMEKVKSLN